ncbi:MAG: tetratricopeptide repeat protein [Pyrinomonadaceae bacterium]
MLLSVSAAAATSEIHAEALYHLSGVYANTKQWAQARATAEQLRRLYPQSNWTVRAFVDAGGQAREARSEAEAFSFFRAAVSAFPARAETASAQFELAWSAHEAKNYAEAARLLIEHVAEYADKNTDFRGRSGYWAARNAERAGASPKRALSTKRWAHATMRPGTAISPRGVWRK